MARRGGSFGGIGLDPFASGSGSLSRYNLGESAASLEALEAYAIALGWQNGTVSDEEYLASLKRAIEFAPEGSKERMTAQDRYDDTVYTIARNKIVNEINAAGTPALRTSLMKDLIAHDESRLAAMDTDNEQYRELQTRIASSRSDIRQSEYGDLVEKVNAGKASTQSLLDLAKRNYAAAGTDPDSDQWRRAITDLNDRLADEKLAEAYQDYQHNRLSGAKLLAMVDARMVGMSKDSPAYKELARQREDLADNIKGTERAKTLATLNKNKNEGKITDSAYLAALSRDLAATEPGTQERIDAENRLKQATFSLAEDKLRYDVQKGKGGSIAKLISFYRSYKATMDPGSAEWRSIDLAIDSLRGRATGGGGGGGSGSGKGKGGNYAAPPKIITGSGDFISLATGGLPGVTVPKDMIALLNINPNNSAQIKWFDNNRRALAYAQSHGLDTWVYVDQKGKMYQMPYTPSMLSTIQQQNIANLQYLVLHADDPYHRQIQTGKLLTALQQFRDTGGTIAMADYRKNMAAINSAKERALAMGDYATYANLTLSQQQLIRSMLMIPDGAPTDARLAQNPVLDASDLEALSADIDQIEPRVDDPTLPGYSAGRGDAVLAAIADGTIVIEDRDGDGIVETAELDPWRGYLTQDPRTGQVALIKLDEGRSTDYYTDENGVTKPAYNNAEEFFPVKTEEGTTYWQPIQENENADGTGFLTFPIRMVESLAGKAGGTIPSSLPLGIGSINYPATPGSIEDPNAKGKVIDRKTGFYSYLAGGGVNLPGVSVMETGADGKRKTVWWVTVDGVNFMRVEGGAGGIMPQLVINPDKGGVATYDKATGQLLINGEVYDKNVHGALGNYLHFYGLFKTTDENGKVTTAPEGQAGAGMGFGAPGQYFVMRTAGPQGLDTSMYLSRQRDPDDDIYKVTNGGVGGMSRHLVQKSDYLSDTLIPTRGARMADQFEYGGRAADLGIARQMAADQARSRASVPPAIRAPERKWSDPVYDEVALHRRTVILPQTPSREVMMQNHPARAILAPVPKPAPQKLKALEDLVTPELRAAPKIKLTAPAKKPTPKPKPKPKPKEPEYTGPVPIGGNVGKVAASMEP